MYRCDDDITSFKYVQQKIKIKNKINNKKLTKLKKRRKRKENKNKKIYKFNHAVLRYNKVTLYIVAFEFIIHEYALLMLMLLLLLQRVSVCCMVVVCIFIIEMNYLRKITQEEVVIALLRERESNKRNTHTD